MECLPVIGRQHLVLPFRVGGVGSIRPHCKVLRGRKAATTNTPTQIYVTICPPFRERLCSRDGVTFKLQQTSHAPPRLLQGPIDAMDCTLSKSKPNRRRYCPVHLSSAGNSEASRNKAHVVRPRSEGRLCNNNLTQGQTLES